MLEILHIVDPRLSFLVENLHKDYRRHYCPYAILDIVTISLLMTNGNDC